MWPPMCTRNAALGLCSATLRSKSANDMHRSSRLQSTNSTSAPAWIAASGVAMKVLEGTSTVSPSARRRSQARPARRRPSSPNATAGSVVPCSPQACSKRAVMSPSDQRPESITPSSELVEARAVALVEPDRERGEVRSALTRCSCREGGRRGPARAAPAGGAGAALGLPILSGVAAPWQACQTGRTVASSAPSAAEDRRKRLGGALVGVASAVEVGIVQEDDLSGRDSRAPRAAIRAGVVNLRQSLPHRDHSSGSQTGVRASQTARWGCRCRTEGGAAGAGAAA